MGVGSCQVNNWEGECHEGGGALPKQSDFERQHYTGREETPSSGAAYLFYRECPSTDINDVSPSNSNCKWVEQERIVASDKREGSLFGISVDIDHTQGVALVGSSHSPAYGFYQDPVFVHPHSNTTTMDLPIPETLEDMMKSGTTYSATGGNIRLFDYLAQRNQIPVAEVSKYTEKAGSTYVFLRQPAEYDSSGAVIQKAYWKTTEQGRIAPPDVAARDHFGYSVSLGGNTAVVGAIGRKEGGGAFAYDMEWIRVKFSKVEFVALEGTDRSIQIYVQRDLAYSTSALSIGYSTSDLTAIGVDTAKYDECMNLNAVERDGCGDYEHTSGVVTFEEGEEYAWFIARIIDDYCTERNMEYVQLNLHQLGGSLLRGEDYRAQLRIDDDDWEDLSVSMHCEGGIR
jgi:hypothetical protein